MTYLQMTFSYLPIIIRRFQWRRHDNLAFVLWTSTRRKLIFAFYHSNIYQICHIKGLMMVWIEVQSTTLRTNLDHRDIWSEKIAYTQILMNAKEQHLARIVSKVDIQKSSFVAAKCLRQICSMCNGKVQ